jgi:putative membrane protein
MKLSAKSGFAVLAGLAFSFAYVGCSSTSTTASDSANRSGAADRATSNLSAADQDFATKAAQGGMAEVELGKLAQERGASAHVKEYGKMLVDDHTRLNNELKDIASKENITLPTDISPEQRRNIDRLAKLSGSQFDREFLKDSAKDHREDIAEFEKEAKNGQNQALKNFASTSLPTLREHLKMAEKHS